MNNNHLLSLFDYLQIKKSESKFFEVLYYIYTVIIFYAVIYFVAYGFGYLVATLESQQFFKSLFN
jgi:hypothetical protein